MENVYLCGSLSHIRFRKLQIAEHKPIYLQVASPSGENHSRMSFGPTCLTPAGEFSAWLTLVPTPTNLSSLSRFGHALTWTGSTRCLEGKPSILYL
ncbi:hypothetical protein AMECASPLE_035912 [Ameca splendens]|uniref:Uncharacterized protein n=1 Tax=Ameca splendens TaxID=208324 RepID=A0ABV0ZSS8_9TELE